MYTSIWRFVALGQSLTTFCLLQRFLGLRGSLLRLCWARVPHLRTPLRSSWAYLDSPWASSWLLFDTCRCRSAYFGRLLGAVRLILDVSWAPLSSFRASFERFVVSHGHLLCVLASSWVPWGSCFTSLGSCWPLDHFMVSSVVGVP